MCVSAGPERIVETWKVKEMQRNHKAQPDSVCRRTLEKNLLSIMTLI